MSEPRVNTLLLLSGGIDSMACAHWLLQRRHAVSAAFVDYGQLAAKQESKSAAAIAAHFGMPIVTIALDGYRQAKPGELFGRNAFMVFASVFAQGAQEGMVCFGAHSGTPYFDCSPPFIDGVDRLLSEMSDGRLRLIAPFLHWRKAEIVAYARDADLPLHLTYSCEAGGDAPCGVCPSCHDRLAVGVT